jgi:hypothetical protein
VFIELSGNVVWHFPRASCAVGASAGGSYPGAKRLEREGNKSPSGTKLWMVTACRPCVFKMDLIKHRHTSS